MRWSLAAVSIMLFAASCHKQDPGPTCDQIVDNLLKVTKQVMAGHPGMAGGDRGALLAHCAKRQLAPEVRQCLATAPSLDAIAACTPDSPKPR
jgi:hypothetical protein